MVQVRDYSIFRGHLPPGFLKEFSVIALMKDIGGVGPLQKGMCTPKTLFSVVI